MQRQRRKGRNRGFRLFSLSRILTMAILLCLLGYPVYEAYHLKTEQTTLSVSGLPQDLNNLRIAFISDIHMSAMYPQGMVNKLIDTINRLNADIVLFGGDYAEDSEGAIEFFQKVPRINARLKVAGVLGNHDRTIPESNLDRLQNAMVAANVIPLVNNILTVMVGNAEITLAGIDDINNGHPDIEGVAKMVNRDDFVVFLSHSPAAIPDALKAQDMSGRDRWFDLALCGHTHGGQVTFLGQPLIPEFQKVPRRYLSGWIEENRIPILISNGVGMAYLPVRLFAPAQIHLITLKAN
jgi:Predicted phosphohydrolases